MAISLPDLPPGWWLAIALYVMAPLLLFLLRNEGPNRFGGVPATPRWGEAISDFFGYYRWFSGRTGRTGYWVPSIVLQAIYIASGVVVDFWPRWDIIDRIFAVIIVVPSVALTARRLHDTNWSGWWQCMWLFFPFGTVWVFIQLVRPSQQTPPPP